MEKMLRLSRLMDLYGAFLTEKQKDVLVQHNEFDYSLAEIASNLNITRQAVHFAIKGGTETLEDCEKRLGFMKKFDELVDILNSGLNSDEVSDKDNALKHTLLVLGRE